MLSKDLLRSRTEFFIFIDFFCFVVETFVKFRRFLNQVLSLELHLSRFIYFSLKNFDRNVLTYDIQNNNYFFHFLFRHTCACCPFAR